MNSKPPAVSRREEILAEKSERGEMVAWTAGTAVGGLAVLIGVLAEMREGYSRVLVAMAVVAAALTAFAIAVLDLLGDEIRRGTTLEVGLRLDGNTVQVLAADDDTVVIAIQASDRAYVVVYGRPSENWHSFAVTQLEPLTKEHAQQRGIALGWQPPPGDHALLLGLIAEPSISVSILTRPHQPAPGRDECRGAAACGAATHRSDRMSSEGGV